MAGSFEQKLQELIEPIVQSYGYELWGLRYRVGRNTAHLQVFVEGSDGVDVNVCGDITNTLSPILDTADLIEPAYILEVSSPGIDRILFKKEHFAKFIDSIIKVEVKMAMQSRRKFEGKLTACDDDGSITLVDNTAQSEIVIAFENIALARVVPDYSKLL